MMDLMTLAAAKAYTDKKCGGTTPSGSGLPVVELETVAIMEGAPLSAADTAKMDALNGGNCIIKINCLNVGVATGLANCIEMGGTYVYGFAVPALGTVIVTNNETDNGAWICTLMETM